MIKLHFMHEDSKEILGFKVYLLLQNQSGQPFEIWDEQKFLGKIDVLNDRWANVSSQKLDIQLIEDMGRFIDRQHYRQLPVEIKKRWPGWIGEVVVVTEEEYLVISKPYIEFAQFEKVFRNYIAQMVRDEWKMFFRVFNADFSDEFSLHLQPKQYYKQVS